jgi:ATP-binding protein involved in chromosome partitioning
VGKSTVAANLAIALSRAGRKVGLVDADVYGPSQPTLLGSNAKPTAENDRLIPVEAQGLRFLSLGHLVSPGHALAWRGPMATGALARLIDADWGDAEMLVVDLPPGTGDVQLSLIQKSRPDGAVIVSTPQDLSLIDAMRAIDLFRKMGRASARNYREHGGLRMPALRRGLRPFGSGGAEAAASEIGVPFLGRLPLSPAIRTASDAGNPPAAGEGAEAKAFADLAQRVVETLETVRR